MKTLQRFILISISICFVMRIGYSQGNYLFDRIEENTISLIPIQQEKYSKITSSEVFMDSKFIQIGELSEIQENGLIYINLAGSMCEKVVYEARNVEYQDKENYYWYGEVISKDSCECSDGNLMLTSKGGRKYGQFSIDDEFYEIQDLSKNLNVLSKINDLAVSDKMCGVTEEQERMTGHQNNETTTISSRDIGNCDVDVLVLYTNAANEVEANINDRIDLAIRQTNQAFQNSRIYSCDLRLNLVNAQLIPISFTESASISTDVTTIATDPTISALRSGLNADIVILLTKGDYDLGVTYGKVQAIGPNSATAFAIVETEAATAGYVFAHEVGHLFGAGHIDDSRPGIPHGHKFRTCKKRRTIVHKTPRKVIPYYSNPNVRYKNVRTGKEDERDNAQMIRNSGCTVAGFFDAAPHMYTYIESTNDTESYPVEFICPCDVTTVYAEVFDPPGPYQYEWRVSSDGISFSNIEGTYGQFGITSWDFCQPGDGEWCFDACQGVNIFVQLKVIAANGDESITTRRFVTKDTWPEANEACENEFEGLVIPSPPLGNFIESSSFKIYPNPTYEGIEVEFDIKTDSHVKIQIKGIGSNVVENIISSSLNKGYHSIYVNTDQLEAGMYLVSLIKEGTIESQKFIIIK